jgi:dinuclear metal center YbgI/SA1388 family protein
MDVRTVVSALESIAPLGHAEPWDNVGLLVGDREAKVARVLLAIDATAAVIDEASSIGAALIVAYHPPIFEGRKRFLAGEPAFEAARRGIAIWSPHTALDVAEGGTNDVLADALGLADRKPLRIAPGKEQQCKLVTFVPEEEVDRVSEALFSAGAGRIGRYSSCSFRSVGVGTFFGEEGSAPVVGEAGRLERAKEIRVETIVELDRLPEVVAALRRAHPYEEPAFDLVRLAAPPEGPGIGRIGRLAPPDAPVERSELLPRLRAALGLAIGEILVAGPRQGVARTAAVCAGAGGDLLGAAIAKRADVFLTGELRHHDALRAEAAGITVFALRHSVSERCALPALRARLQASLPDLEIMISDRDRDPFTFA